MALRATYIKKIFEFNFNARTSRGAMNDKTSWFIKLWDDRDPTRFGLGESGPLPGLSIDAGPAFDDMLSEFVNDVNASDENLPLHELWRHPALKSPAILFGVETAYRDLANGGFRKIFNNEFQKGLQIPINGLVWMAPADDMIEQVRKKVEAGFSCIKLKIGALDFSQECDVLRFVRKKFGDTITIRVDANGAFQANNVYEKLERLKQFDIHSIEQPLKKGDAALKAVCQVSPIPIALDEELIGIFSVEEKRELLYSIKPAYIILKPTLHGGFKGCSEWIELAEEQGIGWWITSALESNIGLNAICQFTANYSVTLPQGLGTGAIYANNISSPLTVKNGQIFHDTQRKWDLEPLL